VTDERETPPPAQFEWAAKVYEAMRERATQMEVDGTERQVYEGHLTQLYRDIGAPNPYYTSVQRALVDMGCVEQLRRGGGSAMSKWLLVKEPDAGDFEEKVLSRRPKGKVAMLEQQIRALTKRIGELEQRVEYTVERMDGAGIV